MFDQNVYLGRVTAKTNIKRIRFINRRKNRIFKNRRPRTAAPQILHDRFVFRPTLLKFTSFHQTFKPLISFIRIIVFLSPHKINNFLKLQLKINVFVFKIKLSFLDLSRYCYVLFGIALYHTIGSTAENSL